MEYTDRVYGKAQIKKPVILELISSPALQRLKGIDQLGYFEPYFPGKTFTRYEHSLGVFLLLKIFNAPFKEQIAGLIHDVSHTVFSHCGDYALNSGSEREQNLQDNIFKIFVKKTGIPQILEKHKVDLDYILNDENFPLKEKPLPDLCADRIDYFLRHGLIFGELDQKEINEFLEEFEIINNSWVFRTLDLARKFTLLYLKFNSLYWSGAESAVMFRTVGDMIRYSLKKGYLTKEDLFTTDKEVLAKVEKIRDKDKKLDLLLRRMQGKVKWSAFARSYDGKLAKEKYDTKVLVKSRVVNPSVKTNGEIKRISEVDEICKSLTKDHSPPKEYYIKFFE